MNNLIALSGRMGSGKDTAAKILQNILGNTALDDFDKILDPDNAWILSDCSGWDTMRFAGKLKEIASIMTGIPVEKFEDQEFKKTYLGPEWDNMQVRTFLQKLGTEAMRDGVHTNAWINALFANFKPHRNGQERKWILTDCRFQNEFEAVKKRGGLVLYIYRGDGNTGTHPSEVEMEQFRPYCDFALNNNGSLLDLESNLKKFLQNYKLIPFTSLAV